MKEMPHEIKLEDVVLRGRWIRVLTFPHGYMIRVFHRFGQGELRRLLARASWIKPVEEDGLDLYYQCVARVPGSRPTDPWQEIYIPCP